MEHFGEHVMIDGYGGSEKLLNSKELLYSCLLFLPPRLGMRALAAPVVYHADPNDKKDPGGWSGFVVIAESHISIHTFPGRRFVSIDAYTCQNGLDVDFISDFFKKAFALEDMEVQFAKRGTRYPMENLA